MANSCASCWLGLSKFYLIVLTSISVAAGFALLILSLFVMKEFKQYDDPVIRGVAVWGPFGISLAILVSAIAGLCGSCCLHKSPRFAKVMLATFLSITMVLWVAVLIVSIMLLLYVSTCNDVATTDSYKLTGRSDKMNTWQLAVFNKCCVDEGFAKSQARKCGKFPELSGCFMRGDPCACYNSQDLYDDYTEHISEQECEVLQKVKFDGVPLIGNQTSGGCGGGDPKQFQKDFADYVRNYVYPVTFAILGLTIFMLLGGFCTCCLLPSRQEKYHEPLDNDQDDGTLRLDPVQSESITMT